MIPNWVYGHETGDGSVKKYHRAVEELRKQGIKEPTDAQIKDLYVRYGGKVIESDVEANDPEIVHEPVHRGRKPKTE